MSAIVVSESARTATVSSLLFFFSLLHLRLIYIYYYEINGFGCFFLSLSLFDFISLCECSPFGLFEHFHRLVSVEEQSNVQI